MPCPGGRLLRYMSPFSRAASVSAISTVNTWTPLFEAISTVLRSSAKASVRVDRSARAAANNRTGMGIGLRAGAPSGNRNLDERRRVGRAGPRRSVRRRSERSAVRADFRSHHALGAGSEADEHRLAGAQLGDAVAAQCLHVHEDVRRAV